MNSGKLFLGYENLYRKIPRRSVSWNHFAIQLYCANFTRSRTWSRKLSAKLNLKVCWQSPALFYLFSHQAKIQRFRQVSNPEAYLGLLDFCDIAALPKIYVFIQIRIAIFCSSWVSLMALIFLVTICLYFSRFGNEKGRHFDLKFLQLRLFLINETFSVQTAD